MTTAGLRLLKSFSVKSPIRSAVFFPGRKRVVTSGLPDGSAHVWNLDSEKGDAVELRGHRKAVTCLAALRDGNRVITGGEDGEVLLWTIRGNEEPVLSKRLLSLSMNGETDDPLLKFSTSTNIPTFIAAILPSLHLIDVWELKSSMSASRVSQISIPGNKILSASFSRISPDILAVACADQTVKISDVRTGKQSSEFSGSSGSRPQLAWSPVAQRLFSTTQNMKAIHVLTENGGKWERRDTVGHVQPIKSFDIHPNGKFLASGASEFGTRRHLKLVPLKIFRMPSPISHSLRMDHVSYICRTKKLFVWDSTSLCAVSRDSSSSSSSRGSSPRDPLGLFFAKFPQFDYDPTKVPTHEFRRMCSYFNWDRKNKARTTAYKDFRIALTKQFNHRFGTDVNSLASWQSLCARLGVDPIPDSLRKCKAAFLSKNVNLVDLVGSHTCVRTFSTVEELSTYSFKTHRIFPKVKAKAGGLLRYLLRHLENPELDRYRNCDGGRRKHSRSGK